MKNLLYIPFIYFLILSWVQVYKMYKLKDKGLFIKELRIDLYNKYADKFILSTILYFICTLLIILL